MDRADFLPDGLMENLRRFVFSSGIATCLHWSVLWLLMFSAVDAVVANAIGALCGAVANYFLQFHVTFQRCAVHAIAGARYVASVTLGWLANSLLFALLVHIWGWAVLLSQCLALVVIAGLNFIMYQHWVFNEKERVSGP